MDDKVKRYAKFLLIMAGLGGLLYGVDVGVIAAATVSLSLRHVARLPEPLRRN